MNEGFYDFSMKNIPDDIQKLIRKTNLVKDQFVMYQMLSENNDIQCIRVHMITTAIISI